MIDLEIRPATNNDRNVVLSLLKDAALWLQENCIDYWQTWLDPTGELVRYAERFEYDPIRQLLVVWMELGQQRTR